MRRIAKGAGPRQLLRLQTMNALVRNFVRRMTAHAGCVALLLAQLSVADEPTDNAPAESSPQSGVIIRMQLQPSTPAPQAEPSPESSTEDTLDKIPALSIQYKKRSTSSNSASAPQPPTMPVLRRLAQRRLAASPEIPPDKFSTKSSRLKSGPTESPQNKSLPTLAVPNRAASTAIESTPSTLRNNKAFELSGGREASESQHLDATMRDDASADDRLSLELSSPQKTPVDMLVDGDAGVSSESLELTPSSSPTSSSARGEQKRKKVDVDISNELPLDSLTEVSKRPLEPDDVPLAEDKHPFEAPPAESESRSSSIRSQSPRKGSQQPAKLPNSAKESLLPNVDRSTLGKESDEEPFSLRERRIEAGIANCLNYYMTNPENTTRRGPWALMHATLPFGVEGEVLAGNRRVNTIGWLSFNGTSAKQHMFQPTRTGFRPNVGPGMQGHEGQFLAILAQSDVRSDYPLQINGRRYTIMDLARYEMATCREKSELTFKLIGLSRYLEPNQRWRDNRGQNWTLEKMVAEELSQPINGESCGGVHRLMGLSYAIVERQAAGQPITGTWKRAEEYLNNYVQYTFTLQNPDGSFSTNWFESRGMDPDVERRVQTSGHMLEWLVFTLPDEHLRSPQIEQGVEFLLNTVGREPQRNWPIGPRGHALRAMSLYSQRVFGAQSGKLKSYVAEVPQTAIAR